MALPSIETGSAIAQAVQNAVHAKVIEQGWAAEENDTTLSEYVMTMLVEGKDQQAVKTELGGDLLGLGEDDPQVAEFATWLFDYVRSLSGGQQQQQQQQEPELSQAPHSEQNGQDAQMDDAAAPVDGAPTGPKFMRNSARGRRMLGQMNRHIERSSDLPDSLRKIKGAAGGQSGRINAHSRDAPRGPKNGSGLQRMAAGIGRGGLHNNNNMNNMNPMNNNPAMAGGLMGNMGAQQQAQFMQMLEMQAQMMAQMMPNMGGPGFKPNGHGGHRGGRGNNHSRGGRHQGPPQQHAVNGKLPDGPLQPDSAMEVDGAEASSGRGDMFSTLCRFNLACTNPGCGFAHQSPAAPSGTTVDLTDTCSYGAACANPKCSGRHPSPAQRSEHLKQDVDCKFFPNCTNARCPFRHPEGKTVCRNGADCTVPNCQFLHSKIVCRYNPCLNPSCPFKHADGQKRGKFEDKVWTSNGEGGGGHPSKSERFAGFATANGEEELIIPGAANGQENGGSGGEGAGLAHGTSQDTEIIT